MLVALIPPPIDHLGEGRVIGRSFQLRETGRAPGTSLARASSCWISRSASALSAVVEEKRVAGTDGLVDDEEIELIMLDKMLVYYSCILSASE